jgi:hypothetical protein
MKWYTGNSFQRRTRLSARFGHAARNILTDGTVDLHPGVHWVQDYTITPEEIGACAARGEKFKVPTVTDFDQDPVEIIETGDHVIGNGDEGIVEVVKK